MKDKSINCHCHILYEVDDGAKNVDMALEMLRIARDEGIEDEILTFHFFPNSASQRDLAVSNFNKLNSLLTDEHPRIHLGNEIKYDSNSVSYVNEGKAFSLAGSKYVLLEFGLDDSLDKIQNAVRSFKMEGYRPVIAHAERYMALDKVADFKAIVDGGALIQINAKSFHSKGFNLTGKKMQKKLLKLLELGLVHFVADDCHNLDDRRPCMGSIYEELKEKGIDENRLRQVFYENPKKILQNQII